MAIVTSDTVLMIQTLTDVYVCHSVSIYAGIGKYIATERETISNLSAGR